MNRAGAALGETAAEARPSRPMVAAEQVKERHLGVVDRCRHPLTVYSHCFGNHHRASLQKYKVHGHGFWARSCPARNSAMRSPAPVAESRRTKHTPSAARSKPGFDRRLPARRAPMSHVAECLSGAILFLHPIVASTGFIPSCETFNSRSLVSASSSEISAAQP